MYNAIEEINTMNSLVIYDSLYGNTEKIARSICIALQERAEVIIKRVNEVTPELLAGCGLLVVGSPTQRFNPTPAIADLLKSLPRDSLKGVKVAAFDTRLTWEVIEKTPPLASFERIFGFAASRIAKALKKKGGVLVVEPQGFFVEGMEGPLSEGEVERAGEWARKLFA